MKIYPLLQAIKWKYGNEVTVEGLDVTTPAVKMIVEGTDKVVPNSESLIKLCKEYEDATDYIRKRKAEYPSIEDQLDMMFNDIVGWRETITKIKNKHPKPVKKKKTSKKKDD
jgi:prefoldin subunit 5